MVRFARTPARAQRRNGGLRQPGSQPIRGKHKGMSLSDAEFDAILSGSKRIEGNIHWTEDEDRSPARVFRAEVQTDSG